MTISVNSDIEHGALIQSFWAFYEMGGRSGYKWQKHIPSNLPADVRQIR